MNKEKILIIGSGPIIIGQAAEFDYSGTQACIALKKEGYDVVLINPNPATIMTDKEIASKIYMEPLTVEFCKWLIVKENIKKILPGLGGQIALNLTFRLDKLGILSKYNVKILGTSIKAIEICESRVSFKKEMQKINIPTAKSKIVNSYDEAINIINEFTFPVVLRPSFTMGGAGGGIVYNLNEFKNKIQIALFKSPIKECLVEESLLNYKEIEYEAIRDGDGNKMIVCNMENIDPVGVHTGDSIVIAPSVTLNNQQYHFLRSASLKIIEHLKIEGGCNVQLAIHPNSNKYFVIEVNPRVSRSSALASKATGYPIAQISTLISIGKKLDALISPITKKTKAIFEPTLDYIVTKIPAFSFDKFHLSKHETELNTQMQATGEVMSIGMNFCESLLKSIRGLNNNNSFIWLGKHNEETEFTTKALLQCIKKPNENRLYQIYELIRRNQKIDKINKLTGIDNFFLNQLKFIFEIEKSLKNNINSLRWLKYAKKYGYSDYAIAKLWKMKEIDVYNFRKNNGVFPYFKVIDTCSNEFESVTPYYYSTYTANFNDLSINNKEKILILGSGPIKVGQGIEFDYSTVHAIMSIQKLNYDAIIINNNPETVSTDYTISDSLFFEPITFEDIMNIINYLEPYYLLLQFGGQIALNLSNMLEKYSNIKILGTSSENINKSENRDEFTKILEKNKINKPDSIVTRKVNDILQLNEKLNYPVLIRPSYVIAGRAMEILFNKDDAVKYIKLNKSLLLQNTILIDKYISGNEFEVDCICDNENIWIPAILEHVEKAGIHSGDSTLIYPAISLTNNHRKNIIEICKKIAKSLDVKGFMNVQFIKDKNSDKLYVIEVNLRSSRTIPFICKAVNKNIVDVAIKTLLNISLKKQSLTNLYKIENNRFCIKSPVFSFHKLIEGSASLLGPEMQSTGESWGSDITFSKALYKSLLAANVDPLRHHSVVLSINKEARKELLKSIEKLNRLGYDIYATQNTYKFLKHNNVKAKFINKIGAKNNIIQILRDKPISFVINIPGKSLQKRQDLHKMRQYARTSQIALITNIELAKAVCEICANMKFQVAANN